MTVKRVLMAALVLGLLTGSAFAGDKPKIKLPPDLPGQLLKVDLSITALKDGANSHEVLVQVYNRGLSSFSFCFLRMTVHGKTGKPVETVQETVPGLPGGGKMWIKLKAQHVINNDVILFFEVDSTKKVQESNEKNNTRRWDRVIG